MREVIRDEMNFESFCGFLKRLERDSGVVYQDVDPRLSHCKREEFLTVGYTEFFLFPF